MKNMKNVLKKIIKSQIPTKRVKVSKINPITGYTLLLVRNAFVAASAILFLITFVSHGESNIIKAVAYFLGAGAYLFECLSLTDCFRKKVDRREMFMVYCLGPLYILMGIDYILWH